MLAWNLEHDFTLSILTVSQVIRNLQESSVYANLPIKDTDDSIFARQGDHTAIGWPGGLGLAKTAHVWREAEDLEAGYNESELQKNKVSVVFEINPHLPLLRRCLQS